MQRPTIHFKNIFNNEKQINIKLNTKIYFAGSQAPLVLVSKLEVS